MMIDFERSYIKDGVTGLYFLNPEFNGSNENISLCGLKIGDIVNLKGSSLDMTVFEVHELEEKVLCSWFVGSELLEQEFSPKNLKIKLKVE